MRATQTTRERIALSEWRDAITTNVGTESSTAPKPKPRDRKRDDLGAMRAVIWSALIAGLLMVSSCVIKTNLTLAHAQTGVAVVVHGLSWHQRSTTPSGDPYNEHNTGLGLRLDTGALIKHTAVQAGRYRNSYSTPQQHLYSNYVLADYTPLRAGALHAGAFAGVVTGYPWQRYTLAPAGGLTASANLGRIALALRAGMGKHAGFVGALELRVSL